MIITNKGTVQFGKNIVIGIISYHLLLFLLSFCLLFCCFLVGKCGCFREGIEKFDMKWASVYLRFVSKEIDFKGNMMRSEEPYISPENKFI